MKKVILSALLFSFSANAQTVAEFMQKAEANRADHGLTYTLTITANDGTMSYATKQKGNKWKMESANSSFPATVLFDGTDITVSVMGMAVKDKNVPNYAALPANSDFVLGEQTVKNGTECRLLTDDKGTTVCVSERFGIPVYTKTDTLRVDITDIRETALTDADFTLPVKTQLLDMSEMFFGK